MNPNPKPPDVYEEFVKRFPKLARAWEDLAEAGREGPLDSKTARLLKLAVAIGALREGAVHASVRKALAQGISSAEIEQVIALAAGTIGLPAAVAVFSWARDEVARATPAPRP
jgi:alkylhydroperoxidase/carboxymuconolactone decarboxylase family protein YurZ